jgi:hypothetical protein
MRCYHRSTRTVVDLDAAPLGSAQFFAECARIAEVIKVAGPPKPGTLGLLISAYRSSREFLDLQARTRADYQRCLDYLKPIQDIPLARLDRALVVRIRDKAAVAHRRRFGNYVKTVLSILFAWGRNAGTRTESRREITEHPKTKRRARSQSALVRRGTPRCPRCRSRPYTVRYRADDVHGTSAEGRASTTPALLQGRGNCHPALEDWRTRLLARPGGTS